MLTQKSMLLFIEYSQYSLSRHSHTF